MINAELLQHNIKKYNKNYSQLKIITNYIHKIQFGMRTVWNSYKVENMVKYTITKLTKVHHLLSNFQQFIFIICSLHAQHIDISHKIYQFWFTWVRKRK